ncbi:outer membrane protein assembly factor BamB family protein [Haloarchaeobius sp. DT45]|uniref:outer membrane protein assembly factor BamB family protein n=1 Tax=Haloarchaeobius sp. DT45 TaxID=3446116 RepID=UPI003F6B53E2
MQRRGVLATLGALATGGCLRLQEADESATGSTAASQQAGDNGGDATNGGDETVNQVSLSEQWRSDMFAANVWTTDGTFFFNGFDGAAAATPADGVMWSAGASATGSMTSGADAFATDGSHAVIGFSGGSGSDASAHFHGYDTGTGEELWQVDAPADGNHTVAEASAVVDGLAVVGAAAHGSGSDQTPVVYGIDIQTGEQVWETTVPALPNGFIADIIPHDGDLYVSFAWKGVRVVDPRSGSVSGTRDSIETGVWGSRLHDGVLYAPWDGAVVAYEFDGSSRWTTDEGGDVRCRPAVDDELVVVGTKAGFVHAFATETGEKRWDARIDSQVSAIDMTSSHVWVAGEQGTVTAYTRDNGTLAHESTHDLSGGGLGVVNDTVFIGGNRSTAFRIDDA